MADIPNLNEIPNLEQVSSQPPDSFWEESVAAEEARAASGPAAPVVVMRRKRKAIDLTGPADKSAGTPNNPIDVSVEPAPTVFAAKDWCFTLYDSEDTEPEKWKEKVSFCVWQREKCPETGRLHLQGFVQFKRKERLSALKKLHPTAHWEKRRGSAEEAAGYCEKDDTRVAGPWKYGEMSSRGMRTDLKELAARVQQLGTMSAVCAERPDAVLRYSKGIQTLLMNLPPPPLERELKVWLFYGKSRTGKTHTAVHMAPPDEVYIKNCTKWWDGYQAQKHVVWDDFAGAASHVPLPALLQMLDKWRTQIEVKGSEVWLRCNTVVVTTNVHPRGWYQWRGREEQYSALLQRFYEIRVFHERGEGRILDSVETESFIEHPESWGYVEPEWAKNTNV